jgi:hypothetical protein
MRKKFNTEEISWNRVILDAMLECGNYGIDEIFRICEEKFRELNVPEREMALRLFALAVYCDKIYNWKFFESAVFSRFSGILSFARFRQTVEMLIKKEDPALVVFWSVFRLSFKKTLLQSSYLRLEKEMREKSLGLIFLYLNKKMEVV